MERRNWNEDLLRLGEELLRLREVELPRLGGEELLRLGEEELRKSC